VSLSPRLLWKLLLINSLVIVSVIVMVWLSVDYLAAAYFVKLMEKYHISPEPAHEMFVGAVHRYLVWASIAAFLIAALLSFVMMRRALAPLGRMTQAARQIAEGDYRAVIEARTRDEIGQLARAFNLMAASLDKNERLRKQLIIDVAHELRTPLTNIRGYLEGFIDGVLAPSRENLESLHEETLRLALLVEDVLELARADISRAGLRPQFFSVGEYLHKLLAPYKKSFADKKIETLVQSDSDDRVWADPAKISRVLKNLLQNALQYTPNGSRVTIQVTKSPDYVTVAFTNPAPEIGEEEAPLLFERFYRGEKSRSRDLGGAGIGLSIVKELVEAHGGKAGADLSDQRLSIWFTLPVKSPSS